MRRLAYLRATMTREPSRAEDIHRAHLRDVLVSAAAHAQQHGLFLRPPAALRCNPADRVRRLQRGDDPLQSAQKLEALERLVVGDRDILRAPAVLEERVLRANTGVIESGGN